MTCRVYLVHHRPDRPVPVPQGLHELGPLAKFRTRKLPQVEKACKDVLALPVHPALSMDDLETVAKAVVKTVV